VRAPCFVIFLSLLLLTVIPARGEDNLDGLYPLEISSSEQLATTSRSPRPTSRIAENITVINADRIATLNAHTLADILQTVPGFQLQFTRTPGSIVTFSIQGSADTHVQLLLDGVPQNELSNNFSDPGSIPAHIIERVEIIKGAASAVWGPALGGVINVITKSADHERRFGGSGLASYGERGTSDLSLEASGTLDRFGYYLAGSNLHSAGLQTNNGVLNKSLLGKLSYDLPNRGAVTLGLNYRTTDRGTTASPPDFYDYRENITIDHFSGYLNLTYPLADKLSFELLLREKTERLQNDQLDYSGQNYLVLVRDKQTVHGASARLIWGDALRSLTGGVEYEHAKIDISDSWPPGFWPPVPLAQLDPPVLQSRQMDRFGIFSNGAYTVGELTILPGIRFDQVNTTSDYFSYTLGATYQLTGKTTLRAYGARAYSLPYAMMTSALQKVKTVQTGFESGEIPYLWLKGSLFYNLVDDQVLDFSTTPTTVNITRQKRQGVELEARTTPLFGFSLSGGYTYTDIRARETNEKAHEYPISQAKLALNYNSSQLGLKGILTGNYVWWRLGEGWDGHSSPMIWDLSLTQKLHPGIELSPEIFFTGHNLFNGSQYKLNTFDNNPHRWVEGGVRFSF